MKIARPIHQLAKYTSILAFTAVLAACSSNQTKPVKTVKKAEAAVSATPLTPVGFVDPLEDIAKDAPFSWDNATVYFVMTDRFYNGNKSNDNSYGREGDGEQEIGTFHGGDLKGLTLKINEGYFDKLGVNALWITAPYQQILGWVVGGEQEFKHYAYHGYYALDYTVLDANMGTNEELREFVDTAHDHGIRVVFDIVMNHPGYAEPVSLDAYGPDVIWEGWEDRNIYDFHNYIAYNSFKWKDWWGRWIRADLPGSASPGVGDLTGQLNYLPDFRTERKKPLKYFPQFLLNKPDSKARPIEGYTVRQYLIKWLTDWVREYGIDGFRADTVKHVERGAWKDLKAAAVDALEEWKRKNPSKKLDDKPFWMTGEVWGHGILKDAYYSNGFDSLINFEFQDYAARHKRMEEAFSYYAKEINSDPSFNVLTYISSHDTRLFNRKKLDKAGTFLMLLPGAVQIYYGDESGRPPGPAPATDRQQATRSFMNWDSMDTDLLKHWQRLGLFRKRHLAVGMGSHRKIADEPYTFNRKYQNDEVVIAVGAKGNVNIEVGGTFADGDVVRDAYSGNLWMVDNGKVALTAHEKGVVLLEKF